jgi:hypothetical protein
MRLRRPQERQEIGDGSDWETPVISLLSLTLRLQGVAVVGANEDGGRWRGRTRLWVFLEAGEAKMQKLNLTLALAAGLLGGFVPGTSRCRRFMPKINPLLPLRFGGSDLRLWTIKTRS